ncbi:MAG: hypothetical protein WCJ56_14010 [bacterium]
MKDTSTLCVYPRVIARTPRHLGINVETQDHADRTNLWDWLANSGVSVVREFHPEATMRVAPACVEDWAIADVEEFHRWRQWLLQDPAGAVRWGDYRFTQNIPWMGVPDEIAGKVNALNLTPLYSLGYATRQFPRPLVRDVRFTGIPDDSQIDWAAAAVAYEYYFAMIYHYASEFDGRYFMMINEPENQWGWFHLPEELEVGDSYWLRFFQNDGEDAELGRLYGEVLSTQYAVMARLARLAMEDVRGLLGDAPNAAELFLSGPTTVFWEPFWRKAGQYLDANDYHFYHEDSHTYAHTYPVVEAQAAALGKGTAITEFNRFPGGIPLANNLFTQENSLAVAEMLLTVLGLPAPDGPLCEYTTLYLLHFPSTHRNYKHLLYGDMNVVDWAGRDMPLRKRGEEWYPTFEELQIRHTTPAYHMFRMLNRCVAGAARDVLQVGLYNPTTSGSADFYGDLRIFVVDKGDEVVVTLLNPLTTEARNLIVDLSALGRDLTWAVQRETSSEGDVAVREWAVTDACVTTDIAAQSLTQIIFASTAYQNATALRLPEDSLTPGSVATGLSLEQTTRLRAWATVDGVEYDVTERNIRWSSSAPEIVSVGQGGLVQRLRNSTTPTVIRAELLNGRAGVEVTIAHG